RGWFGRRSGDHADSVRALSSLFLLRRRWHAALYAPIGTRPMWSNRRVPAATSPFNMDSQAGFGAILFAHGRVPLHIGYRFSPISNGGLTGRNPGLEVHQIIIGARVRRLR